MAEKISHNALVVVADGAGARFFRNSGHEYKVTLSAESELGPPIFSMTVPQESAQQSQQTRRLTRSLRKTVGKRAVSPCPQRRLCGPCPHRRPADLGPNPPDIA